MEAEFNKAKAQAGSLALTPSHKKKDKKSRKGGSMGEREGGKKKKGKKEGRRKENGFWYDFKNTK